MTNSIPSFQDWKSDPETVYAHYNHKSHAVSMSNQLEMPHPQYKIEGEEKKNAILTILSDRYCRAIIEAITYTPKSVIDLTAETKIPMSTVYRRIQMLQNNKLLLTSGTISMDGKKLFLYKSKIKGIQSSFENGQTKVKLFFNQQQ